MRKKPHSLGVTFRIDFSLSLFKHDDMERDSWAGSEIFRTVQNAFFVASRFFKIEESTRLLRNCLRQRLSNPLPKQERHRVWGQKYQRPPDAI